MSLDKFYRIQNHDDGYPHHMQKVRQYRYEYVNGVENENGDDVYGLFRYTWSPNYIHRGFYHVKDADLGEVWWKVPSAAQQAEILSRYPDVVF